MPSIREELEALEVRWLAPQAALAARTRGRLRPEASSDLDPV